MSTGSDDAGVTFIAPRLTEPRRPAKLPTMETLPESVGRLWKTAEFLPQTVRLLGTRYRSLFLAHAQMCSPRGDGAAIADALAFVDFMARQERVGLLDNERLALTRDARALQRRFRLRREGGAVEVVEKWKPLQWLGL